MGERKGKAFRKAESCRRIEVPLPPLSVAIGCPWGFLRCWFMLLVPCFFIPPTSPTRGIAFLSLPPNVLADSLRSKSKVFNYWGLRALAKIYIGGCKCCNCLSFLPPIAHIPIEEPQFSSNKCHRIQLRTYDPPRNTTRAGVCAWRLGRWYDMA